MFQEETRALLNLNVGPSSKESNKLKKILKVATQFSLLCNHIITSSFCKSQGNIQVYIFLFAKYFLKRGACFKQRLHLHMFPWWQKQEKGRWRVICCLWKCMPASYTWHITFHWLKQVTWLCQHQSGKVQFYRVPFFVGPLEWRGCLISPYYSLLW